MSKPLWFDPKGFDVKASDNVIVETKRGVEFATAVSDVIEISDAQFNEIKSDLKPVLRLATNDDILQNKKMQEYASVSLPVFKQMVKESGLEMSPVSVEYLHDGKKAVFSFEAEERVDFRELIRKLTQEFNVRVDMRQIGARDKSRLLGGIAHCGQELCCTRFGGDFKPMSIRMAKEQDLSLSPQKISGCCGRLMCWLRYEFETYKEYKSMAPKYGAKIACGNQEFRVSAVDMPTSSISLKGSDGKTVKIPLSEFEKKNEDDARPNMISVSTYEQYSQENPMEIELDTSWLITKFNDESASRPAGCPDCKCGHGRKHDQSNTATKDAVQTNLNNNSDSAIEKNEDKPKSKNSRRRRSNRNSANKKNSSEQKSANDNKSSSQRKSRRNGNSPASSQVNEKTTIRTVVRPGQKSSAIRQSVKPDKDAVANSNERPQRKPRPSRNSKPASQGEASQRSSRRKPRERTKRNTQD